MEQTTVDGITLEYEVAGAGEPVVLIHGALIADAFQPLLAEPALAGRYRFISYHRRGYLGSSHTPAVSIAQQAADCRELLRHLGLARVHVVGHSYGGSVALQLALDAPDVVHSLALLEPALLVGASAQSYQQAIARDQQRYLEGDVAGTVDEFLRARFGPGYRDAFLDRLLPGAFEQALTDAGTAFNLELPALLDWRFTETEAQRIRQPVLAVLGAESDAVWPRFGETHRLLLAWLPQAQRFGLPGTAHALQMQNPRDLAEALARFFAEHPLPVSD